MAGNEDRISKPTATPPASHGQPPSATHRLWIAGGVTAGALLLLAGKLCLQIWYPSLKFGDSLSVGLLIVAVLPWLAQLLSSVRLPGGWELVFREIRENQEKQGTLLSNQQEQIRALRTAVRGIVTKYEYDKLVGLNQEGDFLCSYSDDMFQELKRLRALNLVCHHEGTGLARMQHDHKGSDAKFNVKQYFYITPEGRRYLKIRGGAEEDEALDGPESLPQ